MGIKQISETEYQYDEGAYIYKIFISIKSKLGLCNCRHESDKPCSHLLEILGNKKISESEIKKEWKFR